MFPRYFILLPLVLLFLLSGCSNTDSSSDKNSFDSSIVSKTNAEKTGMIATDATAPVQPIQNGIQTMPASATSPVITTGTTAATQTSVGMNPAHGQPGHRCDIAVGAPLNSAPVKAAATKIDSETKTAEAVPVSISIDSTKKQ